MLRNQIQKVAIIALAMLFSLIENTYAQWEPFSGACDFEPNETCDFIVIDTAAENTWVVAKPQKVFFDTAYSNEYAILTDSVNPYPPDNYSYFDIPITITYHNITIDFWHKFDTDTLTDGGYISISYDTGATWYNVLDIAKQIDTHYTGGMHDYRGAVYTDSSLLFNGEKGFSGNSGDWVKSTFIIYWTLPVSLDDFLGYGDIIIRFNFISDSVDNGKEGWMIDSLRIIEDRTGNVKELNQQNFNLFPNPANGATILSYKNGTANGRSRVVVSDLTGRRIEESYFNGTYRMDTSLWQSGVYMVAVYDDDMLVGMQKLVVQ